jgi:alpha-ketoglutarate-dependent taurine dioxygenase
MFREILPKPFGMSGDFGVLFAVMLATETGTPIREGKLPEARHALPLLVEPNGPTGPAELAEWLSKNRSWSKERLLKHGAILFRGFGVKTPDQLESIARGIDSELKNEYLGTSPRDALTDYVFSASELPGFYPIPQHCEMTFTKTPPRRIFFWCDIASRSPGGETPLVDFRRVLADLRPPVRERFLTRGIRIIRNYAGPGKQKRDLLQLKRWDEMFLTTDKGVVSARAREEGFEPTWHDGDRLRLTSEHEVARKHPDTGELAWFNHAQVFHLTTGPAELRRIFKYRPGLRALGAWALAAVLTTRKRWTPPEEQALHCTYRDGSEIERDDLEHVRDVIWQNLVVYPWQTGDVVAIDNNAIGHGRLPYQGPRRIAVCWA